MNQNHQPQAPKGFTTIKRQGGGSVLKLSSQGTCPIGSCGSTNQEIKIELQLRPAPKSYFIFWLVTIPGSVVVKREDWSEGILNL